MNFINKVANEAAAKRGWQAATAVLLGFCIFFAFQLNKALNNLPVRLIPYNFALNGHEVTTTTTGEGSTEYIELMARGDVQLLTDFRPKTAMARVSQLMNRFTIELQAGTKADLMEQADANEKNQISQHMMIDELKARNGNDVLVAGELKRWEGSTLVSSGTVYITLEYSYRNGIPYIESTKTFLKEGDAIKHLNRKYEVNEQK